MDKVTFKSAKHPEIQLWANQINVACAGTIVPACLLAAIVSRETEGKNIYQIGVPRGEGCGVGLCQITAGVNWSDINNPTFNGKNLMDPATNLCVAVDDFLIGLVQNAQDAQFTSPVSFKAACRNQQAFAAAAGYNAGWGKVEEALEQSVDADRYTTNDYAADVLQRYTNFVAESHA